MFFILTINNNKKISELEKRSLELYPKISLKSIFTSSYYTKLTSAFSDQLEFRDYLVKGYYLFQFQKYNGDVVIGKNNELYSAYQRVTNKDSYLKSIVSVTSLINSVADEVTKAGAKFIFLSIPRKDAIELDNLPDSYISSSDIYEEGLNAIIDNVDSNVHILDAYELFNKNKDNNIKFYYTTDHHLTPRAAFLIYDELLDELGMTTYDFDEYYTLDKTIINGSFNNQIGQSIKSDSEELCIEPKFNINYTRYENEKISSLKVYGSGNTYEECFMEGDKAYTVIDTNREDLPTIMYVGSSFTNIFETISIKDFNKMISIDYRHNTTKTSILEYVEKYDVDYVIYVPSQSNNAFSVSMMETHLGK
jgi:hypothetical protein